MASLGANADIGSVPGTVPVRPAFDRSDVVCACYVKSISFRDSPVRDDGRSIVLRRSLASVETIDLYKAPVSLPTEIAVEYELDLYHGVRVGGSRYSLLEGQKVLLFLSLTSSGTFAFSDDFLGVTILPSLRRLEVKPGMPKLELALTELAKNSSGGERLRALQLLQGFDALSESTISDMKERIKTSDPELALTALGVLLKTKTPESVAELRRYLDQYNGGAESIALLSVGTELGQIVDPRCLPDLLSLSGSLYLSVRLGAMDSIRRLRSPKSVPTLISRLDDQNPTVQYLAVITLAEVSGRLDGDYAPSMYIFDTKPQFYAALWKKWWVEEGSKLYPQDSSQSIQVPKVDSVRISAIARMP